MKDSTTYRSNYHVEFTLRNTAYSEGAFGVYGRCSGVCCVL